MNVAHGKATIKNQILAEIVISLKWISWYFWILDKPINTIQASVKNKVKKFAIAELNSGTFANQTKNIADSSDIIQRAVFQLKMKKVITAIKAKPSMAVVIFKKNAVPNINHHIHHFIRSSREILCNISVTLDKIQCDLSNSIIAEVTINKNNGGSNFKSNADWNVIMGIK